MSKNYEKIAEKQTRQHIVDVTHNLIDVTANLNRRSIAHDKSKFEPVEIEPLAEFLKSIEQEGQGEYGTEKYAQQTAMLGDMTNHHYAANDHHPEHFDNGVNDMSLMAILEMLADWKAASERRSGKPMSLQFAFDKYGIGEQLQSIIKATLDELNWGYRE